MMSEAMACPGFKATASLLDEEIIDALRDDTVRAIQSRVAAGVLAYDVSVIGPVALQEWLSPRGNASLGDDPPPC